MNFLYSFVKDQFTTFAWFHLWATICSINRCVHSFLNIMISWLQKIYSKSKSRVTSILKCSTPSVFCWLLEAPAFHTNFRISLFIYNTACLDFHWDYFGSINQFSMTTIFKILSLSTYEHSFHLWIALHVFRFSLISLSVWKKIFPMEILYIFC